MTQDLIERLEKGRDVQSRADAAAQMRADAETIKRLRYSLRHIREMAENAVCRIGRPGFKLDAGNLQQGFGDIENEAATALRAHREGEGRR